MRKLGSFEVAPGRVLKNYTREQSRQLATEWMAAFEGSGAPSTGSYMWHVFSFAAYPSVARQDANQQYELQVAASFIVLNNNRLQALETDQLPSSCSASDFLVFPPNMAWTMAFTHEDGWLGPYFARHPRYDELNRENIARVEKAGAIERAKQSGWL